MQKTNIKAAKRTQSSRMEEKGPERNREDGVKAAQSCEMAFKGEVRGLI